MKTFDVRIGDLKENLTSGMNQLSSDLGCLSAKVELRSDKEVHEPLSPIPTRFAPTVNSTFVGSPPLPNNDRDKFAEYFHDFNALKAKRESSDPAGDGVKVLSPDPDRTVVNWGQFKPPAISQPREDQPTNNFSLQTSVTVSEVSTGGRRKRKLFNNTLK